MPFIRSSAFKHCALFTISISLDKEIISPYSRYAKKGLVYITITDPFSCQPSFYTKYTKLNIYTLCDMRSVSFNRCAFPYYARRCTY